MVAKVQDDNTDEEIIRQASSISLGAISFDDASRANNFYKNEIDRRYKDLPTSQESNANINFFGSSYSGTDIKVIVHMYDEINWKDEKLKELNHKLDISKIIVDGCTNLIGHGFTALSTKDYSNMSYAEQRETFIYSAGIVDQTPESKEAGNILAAYLFKIGGGFSFMSVARMRRAADVLKATNEALVTEYQQRIEHITSLEQANSSSTISLGTLQTISVQTFREKQPVRAFGHTYVKNYTRGIRTIAGSCIFTIFNEHALSSLMRALGNSGNYNPGERDTELSTLLPDQLPPLDFTIVFANEYGSLSDFRLYGVEFFTDGSTFSIEDLLSEQVMNFVARDADIMTSRGRIRISRLQRGMFNDKDDKDVNGSSLLFDNNSYNEYLDRLGMRRRLTQR